MSAGLGCVVAGLHAQQQIHADAEGLFQAQGHLRRDRGFAVGEVGQRGPSHAQDLGRLGEGEPERLQHLLADHLARMGWVLHRHGC